jgi:hypothetical protein
MGMVMTELQDRLWTEMLRHIDEYRRGEIGFVKLVRDLEGLLDAGEIKDAELIKTWYEYWTPLEVRNALAETPVKYEEVAIELSAMERFLRSVLARRDLADQ